MQYNSEVIKEMAGILTSRGFDLASITNYAIATEHRAAEYVVWLKNNPEATPEETAREAIAISKMP